MIFGKEEVLHRFKNILVVVDEKAENRAAIERAVDLAQRNQARLTLVSTIKESPRQAPMPDDPESLLDIDIIEGWPPDADRTPAPVGPTERLHKGEMPVTDSAEVIRESIVREESQQLKQWVDFIRQSRVPVTGKTLYGTPFLEIIREVLRHEHDLVMIAAQGRGGLTQRLFGSTAIHLMRKCPCPVWVVSHTQPEHHTGILAAVDLPSFNGEPFTLDLKIMDLATALARQQQSDLVVVHTWTFPADRHLSRGYLVARSELERWGRQARDMHRRRLAKLLRPYLLEDLKSQVYMLKGESRHWIPELAARMEVGVIVMGALSPNGVAAPLIGNTAERILRQVDCPVLTVKPNGFATPVTLNG